MLWDPKVIFNISSVCVAWQHLWPLHCSGHRWMVESTWRNIVEASIFTAAKPMPIEAHTIAPWIAPIARASSHKHRTVERYFFHCYYKNTLATSLHVHYEYVGCNQRQGHMGSKPVGCSKQLAELVLSGRYDPARTKQMTQSELREICQVAEISVPVNNQGNF